MQLETKTRSHLGYSAPRLSALRLNLIRETEAERRGEALAQGSPRGPRRHGHAHGIALAMHYACT